MDLYDELSCIFDFVQDLQTLQHCLLVCKIWSDFAKRRLQSLPFYTFLRHHEHCVQHDLVTHLYVTPRLVQSYPFKTKRRYGGGCYHLFPLPDTIHKILKDHGGLQGIEMRKQRRELRSWQQIQAKQRLKNERESRLKHELQRLGCTLRPDSHICSLFIQNGNGDPRLIAEHMAYMRWLHEYTDYSVRLDEEVQAFGEENGFYHGIAFHVGQMLQEEYNVPPHWPWL